MRLYINYMLNVLFIYILYILNPLGVVCHTSYGLNATKDVSNRDSYSHADRYCTKRGTTVSSTYFNYITSCIVPVMMHSVRYYM